jgi:hypothetical protein
VYYYPSFHAGRDGKRLSAELTRNLTRPTAWEAVMRIRCSRGLKISSFHGHFFNRRCVWFVCVYFFGGGRKALRIWHADMVSCSESTQRFAKRPPASGPLCVDIFVRCSMRRACLCAEPPPAPLPSWPPVVACLLAALQHGPAGPAHV